jgi:hypothetical protein
LQQENSYNITHGSKGADMIKKVTLSIKIIASSTYGEAYNGS